MGKIPHESAATTAAVRRAIQHSQESLRALAKRDGINQKIVAKWKKRTSVFDLPTGPPSKSTVLPAEDEAIIVAFRRHTLLPLDDCLYSLQATILHLTRSSLHRCLQRHGTSRLPYVAGDKPIKRGSRATRSAISISRSRPIALAHRQLHRRLQFWSKIEDPQEPHTLRVHPQTMDNSARRFSIDPLHQMPD